MASDIARFRIKGKLYTTAALEEINLRDLVLFNTQVADLGLPYTWADAERIGEEIADLSEEVAGSHPDALFLTAVTIWASRRASGDDVTFSEAIDIKMRDLEFLPPTEDHRPDPTKRKGKGSRSGGSPATSGPKAAAETTT